MNVCVYNLYHIGDAYFMSSMLNVLCRNNPKRTFYYAVAVGDAFFRHIPNLRRIGDTADHYEMFSNGIPPETLVNTGILGWLYHELGTDTPWKVIQCGPNGEKVLFVHSWGSVLSYPEFRHELALQKWYELVQTLNTECGLDLKFPEPSSVSKELLYQPVIHTDIPEQLSLPRRRRFIYNFRTRSVPSDPRLIHVLLHALYQRDKEPVQTILPMYDPTLPCIPGITFCDRDYGIIPTPSCENLLHTWNIARMCDEVYILPCGACWLMFDQNMDTLPPKIVMIQSPDYTGGLNKSISYFTGTPDTIRNVAIVSSRHDENMATSS